ncbi:hypothetical protein A7982_12975 [Minicystis rosea]|nr:hypothetical protein A7982_12975 [Minicystis rosea]
MTRIDSNGTGSLLRRASSSPLLAAVALLLSPLVTSCNGDALAISSVSPQEGSARGGEIITLEGHGFGADPKVHFGGKAATVKSASDTKIEVIAPRKIAGDVDIEVDVDDRHGELEKGFTYLALPFTFVDTSWARMSPLPVNGGGAAIADGNDDGHDDVFQAARGEGVWIYENDGKGSLVDPINVSPGEDPADVVAVVARDFDGDGHVDLFLSTTVKTASRVLFGDGKMGFEADPDALPPLFGTDQSAVAIDLDDDGDLDLVTVGSASAADGAPGVAILSNKGKGTFVDVTTKHLAGGTFNATGVAVGDVDGDGDPDLFFAADGEASRLYLNDGHGVFQRAAPDAIPYDPLPGTGVPALGDIDGDGSLDVYLPTAGQDRILLNDGKGTFADFTDLMLGPESGAGRSAVIVDLDLDGHADIAVLDRPGSLRLYRNDGTGRFFDYSGEVTGNGEGFANGGLAVGDLDGDGDDDLFVSRQDLTRAALFTSWSPLSLDDEDGDGIPDLLDNCPSVANPDQANVDSMPFRCASASSCQAETGCELHAHGTSAYLFCRAAAVTWADAAAACAARGGDLVTIPSAEDDEYLHGLGTSDLWIGYSDAAMEGTFVWSSGSGTYSNWGMGQPDNAGGIENCTTIGAEGTWNDLPCDAKRGYICAAPRMLAPDPGDACDACTTRNDPGSDPVPPDAGASCDGTDPGTDPDAGAP